MTQFFRNMAMVCTIGTVFCFSSCNKAPSAEDLAIIPQPAQLQVNGSYFQLPASCKIGITDPQLKVAANYLADLLTPATGYDFSVVEGEGDINLTLDTHLEGKEGSYQLIANEKEVVIAGNSYRGVVAGIQTLRQLLPAEIESKEKKNADWKIPTLNIQDSPRFDWRGLMLDVSRHFYTVNEVKEFLDIMALYKMNKFHWHLTDDQGWRIEIKKYPLLTEKGAWRHFNKHDRSCMHSALENTDFNLPTDNRIKIVEGDTLYGGYYTQEEIKDIVAHATLLGIDIIPEVDMPGHMLAAVSNYDGVSCFKETGWGATFSSPVCPGKDSALDFCKNVYKEIFSLFPYKYVHIGGDEVDKTNWKKCPDCQRRIRSQKLNSPEELQSWFIHTMEKFFNENHREMIGWDEILEGGLSKTATVMWWRSWVKNVPEKTTMQNNKIIFTPNSHFYLDYKQDRKSVSKIYNYDPLTEVEKPELQNLVQGVQGNIWCEYIPSRARMHYMTYPRAMAIAELGWSNAPKDWEGFAKRMITQFDRLSIMDVNYRIPDLEGLNDVSVFIDDAEVEVSCLDNSADIHYTTDGTIPTLESPQYKEKIKINETTDFAFRAFRPNGKGDDVFRTRYVKENYAPATTVENPTNGLKATWYAYKGKSCKEVETAPKQGSFVIEKVMIPQGASGKIGLIIQGYIKAPKDDIYTFSLNSDDGSILNIDGQQVIDNDGPHSPKEMSGQKALAAGYHPIEVRYYDFNGGILEMKVKGSDGKDIPFNDFFAH